MKIAFILLISALTLRGAPNEQNEIQELYRRSLAGDKDAVNQCIEKLEAVLATNPKNQLARVYLGSSYTLRSRDLGFGPTKLRVLKQGLAVMDEAVAAAPNEYKIRLVRALTTNSLPAFLGQRSKSKNDFEWLAQMAKKNPDSFEPDDLQIVRENSPPMILAAMQDDLERVLFSEQTIMARLDEIAADIVRDYRERELTVIAVLNGSLIFMADLLRRIPLPLKLDCLSVASYHGGTKSTGEVVFRQVSLPDVTGRHILILDDILDSGLTLDAIRRKLEEANPLSVRVCVLLEKQIPRAAPIDADYIGFKIGNEFVVGYGLDYMERYRNLPCIGVLRKDLIAA